MTIDPGTSIGTVVLTVGDLEAQAAFYRNAIGLHEIRRDGETVELGAPGSDAALVVLVGRPDAPPRPPRTTGLFHLALLVPTRAELARSLRRVRATGHPFTGAADHLVSEALYLDDPEGNGIEIYRDRPRDEWVYADGRLEMPTLPLDLDGVLGSGPGDGEGGIAEGTRVGHVHLQVADIPAAEEFYAGAVGFEPTVRDVPGALFVSAGGYHHHVGLNTWASRGAPAPPLDARGLRWYTIVLPDEAARKDVLRTAAAAGLEIENDDAQSVMDPSGNRAVLVSC